MKKHIRVSFFSALVAFVLASLFAACGNASGAMTTGSANIATAGQTVASTKNTSASTKNTSASTKDTSASTKDTSASMVPLKVMSVDMAISPTTVRNITCGTTMAETYTAVFHFPANNSGGRVKFEYTSNNGRGSMPESFTVRPGQTSATYTFHWSGVLNVSSTVPGPGGVLVTSPNAYISKLIAPSGPCMPAVAAPFKVNSIGMSAGPDLTGHRCGSFFTETYIATFHIAAGGPGGTIVFQYTTTNGRSSSPNVSLHIAAGQTVATYVFKWSGALPPSHTVPGNGIVMVSAPNQMISPSATPPGATGGCSNM